MLDVADYERIRRMVQIEGKTQRQAAEDLGHSRNLIAKALAHSSPPGYRRQKPPPRPVLDSFLSMALLHESVMGWFLSMVFSFQVPSSTL